MLYIVWFGLVLFERGKRDKEHLYNVLGMYQWIPYSVTAIIYHMVTGSPAPVMGYSLPQNRPI